MECHKCKYREDPNRLERCLKCEMPPDGQPMHMGRNAVVYSDAHEGLLDALPVKAAGGRAEGVTKLSTDVEDKLRALLATFSGLSPTDALLLHHVMQGKPLATFRDTLRKVAVELPKDGGGTNRDRAFAWTHAKKLGESFEPFKAIMPTNGATNKGGGKRPPRKQHFVQEAFL